MAFRLDQGSLRPAKKLADGRLRVDAHLTRTGVFEYRQPDGSIQREYRPPEEVFHADSLASFEALPVTDDHPPESVNAANARKYAVGQTGDSVRRDGNHVAASLTVNDAATVAKMERGKTQLSNGYEADIDKTPGVSPEGERYDVVQRNIRGNHVALVHEGRAGTARVRMDAAEMIVAGEPGSNPRTDEASMTLEEALKALGAEKARADQADGKVKGLEADLAKAQGERDAEKARADAADKARTDAAAGHPAAVKARVALETAARAVLGAEVKLDELDDRAIKVAVVKKVDGFECPADKPIAYVEARYDAAIDRAGKATEALGSLRTAAELGKGAGAARTDAIPDEDAARARMNERTRNGNAADKKGT